MPRKNAINGRNSKLPTFVSCILSDDDRKHVEAHLLSDAECMDFVVKMVEQGLKVSFGWDSWNDAALCTITSKGIEESEAGSALSSRGPGIYEALSVAAYKFYEKLGGDLSAAPVESNKRTWS